MAAGTGGVWPIGPIHFDHLRRRERLWNREGRACHWCGRATVLCDSPAPDQATVDHVIPRGRGGGSGESNCVSACNACNQRRNDEDQAAPDHPSKTRKQQRKKPFTPKEVLHLLTQAGVRIQAQQEEIAALSRRVEKLESGGPWRTRWRKLAALFRG